MASITRSAGDELDQIAANVNEMLDRRQKLMEGLRQMSNDIAHDLRTPHSHPRQPLEVARQDVGSVQDYERAVDPTRGQQPLGESPASDVHEHPREERDREVQRQHRDDRLGRDATAISVSRVFENE